MNVKFLATLILFAFIHLGSLAQKTAQEPKKVYRPDIPGNFLIDFGFNITVNAPPEFEIAWFGSSTVNLYYYYPIRLGKSKFMFTPGIGMSLERFKFKNPVYLADTARQDGRFALVPNLVSFDSVTYPSLKKSSIYMNYFDIPLEFRFNAHPEDLGRTFWVAVGARGGLLYNPHSKVKYKEYAGETAVQKERYRHGLNKFHFGLSLRIGAGNFSVFSFYNLTPLFEKGKGPSQTQMTTITTGVSLIGF